MFTSCIFSMLIRAFLFTLYLICFDFFRLKNCFYCPKLLHNVNNEYVIRKLHFLLCLFFKKDGNFIKLM